MNPDLAELLCTPHCYPKEKIATELVPQQEKYRSFLRIQEPLRNSEELYLLHLKHENQGLVLVTWPKNIPVMGAALSSGLLR